jgi:predicted RNA binding protein YcfA (HicA-like mRNA interferase family)
MKKRKLLKKVLANPKNVRFGDIITLIEAFGFQLARVTGSHHIFEHAGLPEIVNIQNRKGKAKAYQVRQFLELVEQHNLELGDEG